MIFTLLTMLLIFLPRVQAVEDRLQQLQLSEMWSRNALYEGNLEVITRLSSFCDTTV